MQCLKCVCAFVLLSLPDPRISDPHSFQAFGVHPGPVGSSNSLGLGGGSMQPPVVTEMATMVPSAASVAPVAPNPGAAPMEAMSGVQNQEEGQAVPPYKYDLLNSLPCEWNRTYRSMLC